MTEQITIDILDVGYVAHSAGKQHGYTNLTDLLDGLRGLLSDVPVDEGWITWDACCGLTRPIGMSGDDIVEYYVRSPDDDIGHARAGSMNWKECGSATITRYRVVRS